MQITVFDWEHQQDKVRAYSLASDLAQKDYQKFWEHEAHRLSWTQGFDAVHDGKFAEGQWFLGGKLNASFNCLDRHVEAGKGHKPAIIFENEAGKRETYTYAELLQLTKNIAAQLVSRGVGHKDRVAIYMPMNPQAVAAMLACARIGAIHTVVFGGFSESALADRIHDSQVKAVITAEKTTRKGKDLRLKDIVLTALQSDLCKSVSTVLCFDLDESQETDVLIGYRTPTSYPDVVEHPKGFCAQDPLFILYTSGTTGKPKGIYHATGGYLTQVASTSKWVFDLGPEDVYWCTADVGWITGHSYITYGPLSLGTTIFMYDGALNWPQPSRFYHLIQTHKVSVLYTAPTAIRMFMQAGESHAHGIDLSSLRLLGTVGEPINPEAWSWYRRVFGGDRAEIIDSWWQTETGAMMITPVSGVSRQKAGSASTPFLGVRARIFDDAGQALDKNSSGYLVIEKPWPSLARGIWGDQERFHSTYFKKFPGFYFTGDGAKQDADGDFVIGGRVDDVVNISGHRLGTAEIESALVAHDSVAEAAVVGIPDKVTGQQLVAFVSLIHTESPSQDLGEALKEQVKKLIGSFARPKEIHFEATLPKTRSGKIMRRLLRAKAQGQTITSDVSTLDDATASSLLKN